MGCQVELSGVFLSEMSKKLIFLDSLLFCSEWTISQIGHEGEYATNEEYLHIWRGGRWQQGEGMWRWEQGRGGGGGQGEGKGWLSDVV